MSNHQLVGKTWLKLIEALIKRGIQLDAVYISAPMDALDTVTRFKQAMDEEGLTNLKVFSFEGDLNILSGAAGIGRAGALW